jgi:hypothetical protein
MWPSAPPFDRLIEGWFPLTYALNNLNRGLGLSDAYPFVLSSPVIDKLRYVDEVVGRERQCAQPARIAASEPPSITS